MRFSAIILLLFISSNLLTQETGFRDDFNNNQLGSFWSFSDAAFSGVVEEGVLEVTYNRTDSSGPWEQFNIRLPELDITANPYISFMIKSDVDFNLAVKPENRASQSDWLEKSIKGDGTWQEVFFEILNATTELNRVYFYFDGGSNEIKNGLVQMDDFEIGSAIELPLSTAILLEAIFDASNLYNHSIEGTQPGQYPAGSKDSLLVAMEAAQFFLENLPLLKDQHYVDSIAHALYDQCTQFEIQVFNSFEYKTVDSLLVYGAQNLYTNLHALKGSRFLYGMHDATGYGVGWSGDDDRSDVEDVTGSLPAFFSWDANAITRKKSIDRFSYRIENAHRLGGVNSLAWHQYDPAGKGFYITDIDQADSLSISLLPNGENNQVYKEKLISLANYFKSLRDDRGRTIPILFRPFHEHNGWWFWWGFLTTSEEVYIDLWQYTVQYLKDSLGVHNLLYVFSPDGQQIDTARTYVYGYPGDDYIDILGLDFYFGNGSQFEIDRLMTHISEAVTLADQKNKVAAISEIGDSKNWDNINALEIDDWHTKVVLNPLKKDSFANRIAYLSTWRNESATHHFAPYPGHKSVLDFLQFYGDTTTIFLNNLVKGITDSLYGEKLNERSDAAHLFSYIVQDSIHGDIQGQDILLNGTFTDDLKFMPSFGSSMNSTVTVNGEEQFSGASMVNLSAPTWYTVTSENQQVSRDYLVTLALTTPTHKVEFVENQIDIYPLPARGRLNIQTTKKIKSITIYSYSGQLVKSLIDINKSLISIDISTLNPGQHIFNLHFDSRKVVSKIITIH